MGVVLIWPDFVIQPLRKEGDSNPRYPNRVRQFSKLVVSATHPSFQTLPPLRVVQMYAKKTIVPNVESNFFNFLHILLTLLVFESEHS